MVSFYFSDVSEDFSHFIEAFLFSYVFEVGVNYASFHFFSCRCSLQVFRC